MYYIGMETIARYNHHENGADMGETRRTLRRCTQSQLEALTKEQEEAIYTMLTNGGDMSLWLAGEWGERISPELADLYTKTSRPLHQGRG